MATLIDSLKFAREQRQLRGVIPVAQLSRLADLLHGESGAVRYAVIGGSDRQGRPHLRLEVRGALHMQCQRCLNEMEYLLDADSTLRLVPHDQLDTEIDADPDAPECIEASSELDVEAMVEDEILLALPAHPSHPAGKCDTARALPNSDQGGSNKVLPFASLAALKNSGNSKKE